MATDRMQNARKRRGISIDARPRYGKWSERGDDKGVSRREEEREYVSTFNTINTGV